MASKGMLKNNSMKPSRRSIKLIAFHLSLVTVVGNAILALFFRLILPIITHQGQFITVPNLKGASLVEVKAVLSRYKLRFEVTEEFSFESAYPPRAVLQQNPRAGDRVKEGRKIYLKLNAATPPQVKMPNLVDGSLRNAHVLLKSHGLLPGAIQYVPDLAQDAVLEQWYHGSKITPGSWVAKGNKIDLVVGAGLGKKHVETPQLVGMKLETAQFLLSSIDLRVGNITYEVVSDQELDTILYQAPCVGTSILMGESVDLWLVALPDEKTSASDPSDSARK